MEHLYNQCRIEECNDTSWIDDTWASLSMKHTDFVPYVELEQQSWLHVERTRCNKNVKMRMLDMLRDKWKKSLEAKIPEREKNIRHMLKERSRRQSHRAGYDGLIAILPLGTKCDKISITTTATSEIIKTRRMLEELRNKNMELSNKSEIIKWKTDGSDRQEISKVRIQIRDPTSGIDSMTEVLHCLKELGSDVIKMRSYFSDKEFTAELEIIMSKMAEDEVEKAVQKTLVEMEMKLLRKRYSSMP